MDYSCATARESHTVHLWLKIVSGTKIDYIPKTVLFRTKGKFFRNLNYCLIVGKVRESYNRLC